MAMAEIVEIFSMNEKVKELKQINLMMVLITNFQNSFNFPNY